jgi:hypothetical protein
LATEESANQTHSLPGSAAARNRTAAERRTSRRCKITQTMRIRPSDPEREHFEDICRSVSVSRSGLYFRTPLPDYELGMRLFVTVPYTNDPTSIGREYLAEVVRLERLVTGDIGVGLKLLMEVGFQQTFVEGARGQRK